LRLLEFESKRILQLEGVQIPRGKVVTSPEDAESVATEIGGPAYVKAQVPIHSRSKLGGVRLASSPRQAREYAQQMIGSLLGGWRINQLLVEEAVAAKEQIFAAFTYSDGLKRPLMLLSAAGGTGVEERSSPHVPIDPLRGLRSYEARGLCSKLGMTGKRLLSSSEFLLTCWRIFSDYDVTLLEMNPLTFAEDSRPVALDVHMELDDDALERNASVRRAGIALRPDGPRPPTTFEEEAARIDRMDYRGVAGRVIEFDGGLGLLIGGGGASLTIFDAVKRYGGRPADYCEIGGNPTVRKTAELTKLILKKPGVRRLAVITNVLNNTRVDLLIRGVLKGMIEVGVDPTEYPVLFRAPGAWEDEGRLILAKYGVRFYGRETSIDEAARLAVQGFGGDGA